MCFARYAWRSLCVEFADYFVKDGRPVDEGFSYRSNTNTEWMSDAGLADWIAANADKLGAI